MERQPQGEGHGTEEQPRGDGDVDRGTALS